jgi:hypothetical protein
MKRGKFIIIPLLLIAVLVVVFAAFKQPGVLPFPLPWFGGDPTDTGDPTGTGDDPTGGVTSGPGDATPSTPTPTNTLPTSGENLPPWSTPTVSGTTPGDTPTPPATPPDTTWVPPVSTSTSTGHDDRFITIQMDESDISKGYQILINGGFGYEIKDDLELATISALKTSSYRVLEKDMKLYAPMIQHLNTMMDAFYSRTRNSSVIVRSAFRTVADQQRVHNQYVAIVGKQQASRYAALPGFSEHHAGLAVDFGFMVSGELTSFDGTGVLEWFPKNSYKYGFVLRFGEGKTRLTNTIYEPWHYRYVGNPHATIMFENDWCLEEYVPALMEYSRENPLSVEFGEYIYEIYYTRDMEILIPVDALGYEISGNNINGFIVTVKAAWIYGSVTLE